MNLSQIFALDGNIFRVVGTNEKPEFILVDVCRMLGIKNPSDAVADFAPDETGLVSSYGGQDSDNGPQTLKTVFESGLYRLIFTSRKPEAKRVRDWVFRDVLPSIRKTGSYGLEGRLWEAYDKALNWRVQLEILRALNLPTAVMPAAPKPLPAPAGATDVAMTDFVEELIACWKAGCLPVGDLRIEERALRHAPGAPNQPGWTAYTLFVAATAAWEALAVWWVKQAGRLDARPEMEAFPSQRDWKARLCLRPSWVGDRTYKRFGKAGEMETAAAWGFNVDLDPLGYRPCSDEEYQKFVAFAPDMRDPRKGPLFDIIEGVKNNL